MSGLTLASTASMLSPSRALLAGLLVLVSTGLGSSCAASSSSADPSWSDGSSDEAWDASAHHPATVSWSHNCGRVLYTTYHTVGSTQGGKHPGLLPQEMVLFYLLMELTLCQDAPVVK